MSFELYTINGNYPDRLLNFTLTADNMGASPKQHTHDLTYVEGINDELDNLADKNHSHSAAIPSITVASGDVTGDVTLIAGDNVHISASNDNQVILTVNPGSNQPPPGGFANVLDKGRGIHTIRVSGENTYLHAPADDGVLGVHAFRGSLYASTNKYGTFVSKLFHAENNKIDVVKAYLYEAGGDGKLEEIYPNEASHIGVESNYDKSKSTRPATEYDVYGIPVIDPSADNFESLELTITPYPSNAGWTIEVYSDSQEAIVDIEELKGKVYYGKQTIPIRLNQPTEAGSYLQKLVVSSVHGLFKNNDFKFFVEKKASSDITPALWYSFNDSSFSNKSTINGASSYNLVKVDSSAIGPKFISDGAVGSAVQAVFDQDRADTNHLAVDVSSMIEPVWKSTGLSVTMFGKLGKGGTVGLYDLQTPNAYQGSHLNITWSNRQPNCRLLKNTDNTRPVTTAEDRIPEGDWCHLALTLSPPVDILADPRFKKVSFELDSDGSYIPSTVEYLYKSDTVAYEESIKSNQYNVHAVDFTVRIAKLYINGVQQGEKLNIVRNDEASVIPGMGNFCINLENNGAQDGKYPDIVDEVKLFTEELSKADIEVECSLIGIQPDGSGSNTKPDRDDRNGRKRNAPGDIGSVALNPILKVFMIDEKTIAIGACFREFFLNRLKVEYPNLDAVEHNYIYGYEKKYSRDFYYKYNLWDLYRDYQPRIVEALDNKANWSMDGGSLPVDVLGGWQNSTGLIRMPDALNGTDLVATDVADIVHFRYLRLSDAIRQGSTHTISWGASSVTFTYDTNLVSSAIKVNQVGYSDRAGKKYAYIGAWLGTYGAYDEDLTNKPFHVVTVNADGSTNTVYTGTVRPRRLKDTTTVQGVTYKLTGELTYVIDFSAFTRSGDGQYKIYVPGVGFSHSFVIGKEAYGDAFYIHCRGLFHHRSGFDMIGPPYTNWLYGERTETGSGVKPLASHYWTWESMYPCDENDYKSCKTNSGLEYKQVFTGGHFDMIPYNATGRVLRDIRGGWYDAADFDRRPYHFRVVRDLVEAFIRFPENFSSGQLNIPTVGNMPDILVEAEWGLELWKNSQNEAGGIAAWIETEAHENDWPWRSNLKYYQGTHNRRDSLDYACTAAKFARALLMCGNQECLDKSAIYAESAIRAFNFGIDKRNAAEFQFSQEKSGTLYDFTYTENNDLADVWVLRAAASLFTLTKDTRFSEYIDGYYSKHLINYRDDANHWVSNISTELALGDIAEYFPQETKREQDYLIEKADLWYGYQEKQTYHEMNWPQDHEFSLYTGWGLWHPESRGRAFIYAWLITKNSKYRDAAYLIMDNAMGCNSMGRTATTGLGAVAPVHHLDSWLPRAEIEWGQFEPVPGISPYGNIGFNSGAVPYGFCLYQQARSDMNFSELLINILPGNLRASLGNNRGGVAVWLQSNWPLWRNSFECENMIVAQSEFTVWETICGKVFMCGCLMSPGYMPGEAMRNKAPATNRYDVEGLIYLP